jgi:lipid-binding SYLF domain-containing protein
MRSGLWMSGSGGSGILIARKADGTWSPPSGILLHTASLGFVIGVDIYDCVLVIKSVAALELFTRPRLTLGNDVKLAVGPLVTVVNPAEELRWREFDDSVLTYLKARGQHRGVPLDGSLVTERGNENERFYANSVDVLDILAGNVRKDIPEIQPLFEAIKAAEGRSDFDKATMELLSQQPAPGDAVIETPTTSPISPRQAFGVPDAQDPDPFGVIALEMAGLEIREAGTRMRPTSTQFEYNPSPTSPIFPKFNRQSVDTYLTRSNRGSFMSNRTQATTMTDAGTQTDVAETPDTTLSPNRSDDGKDQVAAGTSTLILEPEEIDYTKVDMSAVRHFSQESLHDTTATTATTATPATQVQTQKSVQPVQSAVEPPKLLPGQQVETRDTGKEAEASSAYPEDERNEDADDEEEDDDELDGEEPVVFEVATASQPAPRAAILSTQVAQIIQAKGALVTIPKRIPPPLPVRSPARNSRTSRSEFSDAVATPLRQSFQSEPSVPEQKEPPTPTSRFSLDSMPGTPPTPQAAEHTTSSADDSDRGPKTPRPEDDFGRKPTAPLEEITKMEVTHMEPETAPFTVA